ncbi:uncharacterized protein AMSG_09933 [Thecamonas trahens ATCC 50062]|uniref:Amino acid transporter transmembrane domain-containing protein n=1 Tax=Thecamonas trahens ATCC 50062 TaxID=461836 RepID=A0A0L0DPC3_THETB|nr:hypothetical protein AMSG_09933 [Thecamonas trahens ATCC 50062]KNC54154.1 hypothetical protein AMSG_09933 [Thecamonas trahens ATCC 50062]|eukprot:XP_013753975.1 hypothetical protein AMSG_09933 [Thecamonas trahens ATCC 50062]
MLAVPIVFQQAGWLVPAIFLLIMFVLASLSATLLCEAMALIPGNERFGKRYEYSSIVAHFYGHRAYLVTQAVYAMSLQTLNVASIIVTAQVMDQFFIRVFGKSYALAVQSGSWVESTDLATPFSGVGVVVTLGYAVVTIICLPVGFLNLSEGIYFQYFSFLILVAGMIIFFVTYLLRDLDTSRVPVVGSNMSSVIGTILFNYTFVVTVPSWVNEKLDSVSINKTIWNSGIFTTVGYFVMGYVGALAYPDVAGNVLTTFASSGSLVTELTAYIFSLAVIGLGIPLFSIVIRYNLYVSKVCGAKMASFLGVILPWLISWPLYSGNGFELFVAWSSLIVNSFINFGLPMLLYRTARLRYAEHKQAGGGTDSIRTRAESIESISSIGSEPSIAAAKALLMTPGSLNAEKGLLMANPYDYFVTPVNALPRFLRPFKRSATLTNILLGSVIVFTLAAIVFQFLAQLGVVVVDGAASSHVALIAGEWKAVVGADARSFHETFDAARKTSEARAEKNTLGDAVKAAERVLEAVRRRVKKADDAVTAAKQALDEAARASTKARKAKRKARTGRHDDGDDVSFIAKDDPKLSTKLPEWGTSKAVAGPGEDVEHPTLLTRLRLTSSLFMSASATPTG